MWMDSYVQETLIRQQIAESNRIAALMHQVRSARPPRTRRPWWEALQRFVRKAVATRRRPSAARVTVR